MQPSFPFSAIVGQEMLKRALLLAVIQPSLGGVLIRGTKGVAKSTAVRALAALLPPVETVAGCPFQRRPGEVIRDWPLPVDAVVERRPVPLVELPLGATEDRVLGSLHLEKALRGQRAFEPGLLAAANRGLLFIDEVNLLPDHLVDILLDAAASGTHRVEREGLSLSHPARFVLVGTMNPEEGDLRPQLLDRFGLVVDIADLSSPEERAEAVRRRMAYEADPAAFVAGWQKAETAEADRLVQARQLLPRVQVPAAIMQAVSQRCLSAGVEGLRADLTMCRAAAAWAAYDGRVEVETADVDAVAELALAHRRTRHPEPPDGGSDPPGHIAPQKPGGQAKNPPTGNGLEGGRVRAHSTQGAEQPETIFPSAGLYSAKTQPSLRLVGRAACTGGWRSGQSRRRHVTCNAIRAQFVDGGTLSWAATIRAAAAHQLDRRKADHDDRIILRAEDLRSRSPRGPAGCLLFFLIDASGSMAAWQRMRQTKAAVLALLVQAYRHRDQLALMAFRGSGAELILAPTRSLRSARRMLEALAVGGTTPLAQGMAAAHAFLRRQQRAEPQRPIWTVLLTDGRANVADASTDPWTSALAQAQRLRTVAADCLVVDTETGWPRLAKAQTLARTLRAGCLGIRDVLGRPLVDRYRSAAVG
jgi:magnesium chelatase subunit D